MADLTITAAEVRYRLRSLTSIEISDALLASASYILLADAWMTQILANNNTTAAALDSTKGALMKAAKIDMVAIQVISDAPVEGFKEGFVEAKPISSSDKRDLIKILKDNISELFDICSFSEGSFYVGAAYGGDYHPQGDDATQIDFTEAQENGDAPFRQFP